MSIPETDAPLVERLGAYAVYMPLIVAEQFLRETIEAATRITTLRAQLEAAERERDEALTVAEGPSTLRELASCSIANVYARDAAQAEVAKLREGLGWLAQQQTMHELMNGPKPDAWMTADPFQRVKMMGERKRERDGAIIAARTLLEEKKVE